MRKIVKNMIIAYKLQELGYDMMGYTFDSIEELSFHHLHVSKRYGGPYSLWNGSLLVRLTAHDYLHTIEKVDLDMFYAITREIGAEKEARRIQIENLKRIRDVLTSFEREHASDRRDDGKMLIKKEYIDKRIKL